MFNNTTYKRSRFLLFSLIAMTLTLVVGFILWERIQTQSVQSFQQSLHSWQPVLSGIRWVLIGLLAVIWPYLFRWWGSSVGTGNERTRQLTDLRWRVITWLVLIELTIGQGVFQKLASLLVSTHG